jgi:hypothetical protein
VHKTNSFLDPNFQFVSISKQNETFYASFGVIERKIKTVLIKNCEKITKLEQNETYFWVKVKFSILKRQNVDIL